MRRYRTYRPVDWRVAMFREPSRPQDTKPLATPHNTMVDQLTNMSPPARSTDAVARHDIRQHEPPSSLNPFATHLPPSLHNYTAVRRPTR